MKATSGSRPPFSSVSIGVGCTVAAHVMWGLFPLYWRLLNSVPSIALTAHRIVWAFVCLLTLSAMIPSLRRTITVRPRGRTVAIYCCSAAMIGLNWLAFLYAVETDRVLQASLGYYINPLVNVSLGVLFLGERLRRGRWLAVTLAAIGVLIMTVAGGAVPWIALCMAFSFGIYALQKKQAPLGALPGLRLETGLLVPIAAAYLVCIEATDQSKAHDEWILFLLVLGGWITVSPLVLFAVAAKRVPLSTMGILQFIGPTLQWIVGAIILGESVSAAQLWGFVFVWAGVLVFIVSGWRSTRV